MFGSDWPRSTSLVLIADTIRFNLGSFCNKVAVFWIWNCIKSMSQTWLCGLDIAHTIWTGACLAIWHGCACKKKNPHKQKTSDVYFSCRKPASWTTQAILSGADGLKPCVCPLTAAAAAAQWYFRSRNGFPLLWPLSKKEMYAQCWEMENQFILSHLTRLRRNSQERESVLLFYFSHPSSSFLFLLSLSLPLFIWITILFFLSLNFLSSPALVTAFKAFS